MNDKDYSWIQKLQKGDKVYLVSSSHGFTNSFKTCFVKTINKDTITVEGKDGISCGCYYKVNGEERANRGQWSSNHSEIANPEDESVQEERTKCIIANKWVKLYQKISHLATNRLSFEDKQELVPIMEAFVAEWDKRQEKVLNPPLTK